MRYIKWLEENIDYVEDKIIVITGSNSGIGFETAKYLAYLGGHIVMACRSFDKAMAAKEQILKEIPSAKIDFIAYDQSDFKSIENFVNVFQKKYNHIDILINNAGIYHPKKGSKASNGLPLTIMTNYIGEYYLTKLMMPLLENTFDSRVIFVTSVVAKKGKIKNYQFLQQSTSKSTSKDYELSKACISKMFLYFSKKVKNTKALLAHPGVAPTNIFASSSNSFSIVIKKAAQKILPIFVHNSSKASLGIVKLACSSEITNGTYLGPKGLFEIKGFPRELKLPKHIYNDVEELINETENVINEYNK
ncbi:MAG: SDR family NAD(P)-dependent oxidoreductase [Bacilli bacterium]|nr:SDR family NAD(P)-dependent oxidoreductase [Bacilli bacterium]